MNETKEIYDGKVSGKRGKGRSWLTFENTVLKYSITGGRSRKKHELFIYVMSSVGGDPPEDMYEEVDDSGRCERGM